MSVRLAVIAVVAFVVGMVLFSWFFRFSTDLSMGAGIASSSGPAFIVAISVFWAARQQQRKKG